MPALGSSWQMAGTSPGAWESPPEHGDLEWMPVAVPGTVAGALAQLGRPEPTGSDEIDGRDWWFRTVFDADVAGAGEEVVLCLDGVATLWELFLNGEPVASGQSMFAATEIDVGTRLQGANELALCCRALGPRLAERRRPRARWRTRIAEGNLRFFRTSLHGRAPGFSPGPPPIGPWRDLRLERRTGWVARAIDLDGRLDGADGVVSVHVHLDVLGGGIPDAVTATLDGPTSADPVQLDVELLDGLIHARGQLTARGVEPWWPHTHGAQPLYGVRLSVDGVDIDAGRVGFRTLANGPDGRGDVETDGLDLHVNGARVFARGAVWTPVDAVGLAPPDTQLRSALQQVRDAGMNMLRLPGTGVYESRAFHDLCDELGILVWQDFMFANFDYPIEDPEFQAGVRGEVRAVLERLGGRPSIAVLCGNSEVEQQVAMLGLDPGLGRGPLFGEIIPGLIADAGVDAVYVPSAPCGGPMPFAPSIGIANYFGVGGYRRPLADARLAGARFAAECLAFANLPDEQASLGLGVPRDVGSAWDFADVRDHYLALLYEVDPAELREADPVRYAELSRAVPGEVMAEVMGEWRRLGSPCGGALVLCMRDVLEGAGWGLIDVGGTPKVAYHHLRRALAPVAVWTTDEGLGGIGVHVANDRPDTLDGRLRVSLYRDLEQLVDEAVRAIEIPAHGTWSGDVEGVLGHFRDVSWAYRFGDAAQDLVVVSLHPATGDDTISVATRFPVGRPAERETAAALGLSAELHCSEARGPELVLSARRFTHGVRPRIPGYVPEDDAFPLEPGHERRVRLRPVPAPGSCEAGMITALNMQGGLAVAAADGGGL